MLLVQLYYILHFSASGEVYTTETMPLSKLLNNMPKL